MINGYLLLKKTVAAALNLTGLTSQVTEPFLKSLLFSGTFVFELAVTALRDLELGRREESRDVSCCFLADRCGRHGRPYSGQEVKLAAGSTFKSLGARYRTTVECEPDHGEYFVLLSRSSWAPSKKLEAPQFANGTAQ